MSKVIALSKEHLKKFNLFGMDVSLGFSRYAFRTATTRAVYTTGIGWHSQPINYLFDHSEENCIITHRLILWRFKVEVKSMVEYGLVFT